MKFLDLDREYSFFDWKSAIEPVFNSKNFINGPPVKDFEKSIANYIGCNYAIGVTSGTDAIMVALMALGINSDSVVLTTPYTFIATTEVPMRLGAKVIFSDIDDTFNINMEQAKEVIRTKKVDVFLPVHLFGRPAKIDQELLDLCKERDVKIVEDAAQSMGTKLYFDNDVQWKQVGTFGEFGCFSFFPAKNLGCAGDGGLITTDSKELYEKCITIRNHGGRIKYDHECHGGNFRIDTIQAALLSAKLPYLNRFIQSRRDTAILFNNAFSSMKNQIRCPQSTMAEFHTYNQYVVQVDETIRDKFIATLNGRGVPTACYYPKCLSEQTCYNGINFENECLMSKQIAKKNVALPVAFLKDEEKSLIINSVDEFFRR
jgi:UDP-2-acetamido-2-deoxy-ribo-hexuluronate aminotransferase